MWVSLALMLVGAILLFSRRAAFFADEYLTIVLAFCGSLCALILWSWLGFGDAIAALAGMGVILVSIQRTGLRPLGAMVLAVGALLFFYRQMGSIQVIAALPLGMCLGILLLRATERSVSSQLTVLSGLALGVCSVAAYASRSTLEAEVSRSAWIALPFWCLLAGCGALLPLREGRGGHRTLLQRYFAAFVTLTGLIVFYAVFSAVYFSHVFPCALGFGAGLAVGYCLRLERPAVLVSYLALALSFTGALWLHDDFGILVWVLGWQLAQAALPSDAVPRAATNLVLGIGLATVLIFLLGTTSTPLLWSLGGACGAALWYQARFQAVTGTNPTNRISYLPGLRFLRELRVSEVQLLDVLAIILPLLLGLILTPSSFAGILWGAALALLASTLRWGEFILPQVPDGADGSDRAESSAYSASEYSASMHVTVLLAYLGSLTLLVLWK